MDPHKQQIQDHYYMPVGLMWGLLMFLQIGKKYHSLMGHLFVSFALLSLGSQVPVEPWSL